MAEEMLAEPAAGISVNNAAAAITEPFGPLTETESGLSFGAT